METDKVYDKRIIAFIDILGFQEHIRNSENNNDYANYIKRVMNFIEYLKKDNDDGILSLKEIGREITIFSDSIVISYPYDIESSLFYVLVDIIHIQLELLAEGILMRGGITTGDVYHGGNIVFGPAMVQAYKLESECAIYPRIIMTEETIVEGVKNKISDHSYEQELEYVLGLVKKDTDGFYFIDFLSQPQELDEEHYYYICLDKIKGLITNILLSKTLDLRVVSKYEWLKTYYNTTIKELEIDKEYLIEL